MSLTEEDYKNAAETLNCDIPAIKAVVMVESNGSGFLASNKPKLLFEGHLFHRFTNGKYDKTHPTISYSKWTKKFYKGGLAEYQRLDEACGLDREAAIKSTSFGMFQILGMNFSACGYTNVDEFYKEMCIDEKHQLNAFIKFIKHNKIDIPLREHKWDTLSRLYNGPSFGMNGYDKKLKQAFIKAGGK